MLEFERIRHAYNGSLSVRDVSFKVQSGEVVSLLGPSGCGKTHLANILNKKISSIIIKSSKFALCAGFSFELY